MKKNPQNTSRRAVRGKAVKLAILAGLSKKVILKPKISTTLTLTMKGKKNYLGKGILFQVEKTV